MAGETGGTTTPAPTPALRLKDLLELDCDSCSAAGFRCYPRRLGESVPTPMRHLLESSPSLRLRRRSSKLSHLSRSLSRRLSRRSGFWSWRRDEEEDAAAATAASAGSGTSSEELETTTSESSDNSSGRTSRRSRSESESDFSSATEDSLHHHPPQAAGAGDEHEVGMKRVVSKEKEGSTPSGSEADDKEQLSPVAVMDFPFDDDDEEEESRDAAIACTPSFSLERLQRRKTHKIRRFASRDELAPLDLEARLATTSHTDGPAAAADPAQAQQMIQCRTEDAAVTPTCAGRHDADFGVHNVPDEDDDLTSLLMGTPVSAGLDDASERLLLDFFVEMKLRRSEAHDAEADLDLTPAGQAAGRVLRRKAERVVDDGEAAAAAAARGWLEGTGTERWGLADVLSGGAATVAEMDERGRRWMQVGEEEREVGAVVAGMLADQLVAEVVRCLFFV